MRNMVYSGVAAYAALTLASLSLGYCIGRNSRPLESWKSGPQVTESIAPVPPKTEPTKTEECESDSEDESVADGDLAAVTPGLFEECKLVLVVRSDLGMTKGKIAAQCGHATLACYKALEKSNPALLKHWERIGQAKVALRCDSEEELMLLQATAQSLNLCARTIRDAGRTQIASGSQTVLGIGPGPVKLVNQVTGKLKLL